MIAGLAFLVCYVSLTVVAVRLFRNLTREDIAREISEKKRKEE